MHDLCYLSSVPIFTANVLLGIDNENVLFLEYL